MKKKCILFSPLLLKSPVIHQNPILIMSAPILCMCHSPADEGPESESLKKQLLRTMQNLVAYRTPKP